MRPFWLPYSSSNTLSGGVYVKLYFCNAVVVPRRSTCWYTFYEQPTWPGGGGSSRRCIAVHADRSGNGATRPRTL